MDRPVGLVAFEKEWEVDKEIIFVKAKKDEEVAQIIPTKEDICNKREETSSNKE